MPERAPLHHSESVYPEQARQVLWTHDLRLPPEALPEPAEATSRLAYTRHLGEFAYDSEAVDNLLMAIEYGLVEASLGNDDMVEVQFRPLTDVPAELGHVTTLQHYQAAMARPIWGDPNPQELTYLQATDFSVEANQLNSITMMPGQRQQLVFLYIDTERLQQARHIYLDPESLDTTPLEFGAAYAVQGGIPRAAFVRAELIELDMDKVPEPSFDYSDLKTEADYEREMAEQTERLRSFLKQRKAGESKAT